MASKKENVEVAAEEQLAANNVNTTAQKKKTTEIELFKDSGKYADDVFVAVNGKAYKIKRGERVAVPSSVAEVLHHSSKQDNAAADLMEREQNAYRNAARELNI